MCTDLLIFLVFGRFQVQQMQSKGLDNHAITKAKEIQTVLQHLRQMGRSSFKISFPIYKQGREDPDSRMKELMRLSKLK